MMRPITRAYVDLLISTGAEAGRIGGGMEEGIVLLWAMEKVSASSRGLLLPFQRWQGLTFAWTLPSQLYNTAWRYAASLSPNPASSRNPSDPRTSAALDELIDNWTNEEFDEFVRECEREVDKLELVEGTDQWERAEEVSLASLVFPPPGLSLTFFFLPRPQIFKYVLYLEQRFWPDL